MSPFRLVRTLLLVLLAQYFAFTPNPAMGLSLLAGTFRNWSFAEFSTLTTSVMEVREWIIAGAACLIVLVIDILCEKKKDVCGTLARTHFWYRWPVLILLILAIVTFGVYGAGFDGAAFLYTQF